jgi:hypothetical protein
MLKKATFSPTQPRRLLHPPALSLPRQPLRPGTHLNPSKAAANYHFIRGGWDDPNCARPTRAFSSRALREHGDRPSYPALFFSILPLYLELGFIKPCINPFMPDQGLVRPVFDDKSVVHDNDSIDAMDG